uniref:CCHC-type domain-containing protein n=1 Tax=Tanacetum cinerariifolium TaxID=118510 RepID=A0A6L2L568_TANCI|nr:hypothetical protein [Tanacetum cinerariifolium]
MSAKYPNYVNLTSSSEEQPNERTPSPPPRKKSLSRPQAPSKSISNKSTHYTSSSSPRVKGPTTSLILSGQEKHLNGPTSMGFDMSKVECYNCHRKGHFARECSVMVWAAMTGVFKQMRNLPTMLSWHSHLQVLLLTIRYQLRDGYHVVPPPYTGTFIPPKPDLVFHNVPNDVETVHPAFNVELSHIRPENDLSHTYRPSAPIIEDWISDSEDESKTKISQNTASPKPKSKGNNRNKKACFVCKSLTYLIKDCDYHEKKMAQPTARNHAQRGNHKQSASMTLLNPQRHVVPTAVLTHSKLVRITAVRPVTTAVPKPTMTRPRQAKTIVTKPNSPPRRHINRSPSPKASNFPPKETAVKAPMGNPQHAFKDKGVIDSGCSRHMTRNMSYLSDFEDLNGRYVAFGGNPKCGKISGKGKIRTGTLDFNDVYFVKELKFNLFSVSQMCDKKNSVLFTDTKCLVLSPDFKLPDENQVLLRVPRENNMYNVDLKNIVPSGDLTCLFAKATLNESNLWHIRLGHINFKTMNKLVKATKDETSPILKTFVIGLENQLSLKAEAVNTACYVQNRVLVTKPQNKTPYELLHGRTPSIGFMRPFGCPVTIFNTLASLGKFDGKVDEGFIVGYSVSSKPLEYLTVEPELYKRPCISIFWKTSLMLQEPEFEGRKPESEVNVSLSSSAQSKKHDDKTKREAKGKSPVESLTGYRNLSAEKRAIGTKWVFRNKKDERGIGVRNKARLVAQGHTQEEGIDYEEVFAPVARIEAIRLFLTYDSFMGFMVYQMDVKSAFMYETIEEEIYVCQPLGFKDPDYPNKVYKVVKALYGLHQAPRACMIAYLTKSDASEGFNQIIDFLNGSSIKYALTVNPNIYVSCIKQFWTSVAVKKVNDITRLEALVDKKRVIITEATIRDALHLDDAKGIECLPNKEIFTELVRMGYEKPSTKLTFYKAFFSCQWKFLIRTILQCMSAKRTSWNEFNSFMAFTIICLSTGKGFSGVKTPRFEGMIVEQQVGEGADEVHVDDVSTAGVAAEGAASVADDEVPAARVKKLESRNKAFKLRRLQKVGIAQRIKTSDDTVIDDVSKQGRIITDIDADKDVTLKDVVVVAKDVQDVEIKESLDVQGRQAESQAQIYQIDLEHADKVLSMQDVDINPVELQKVVEVVTIAKLITKVVTAASTTITAAAPQLTTAAAPTITTAPSAARMKKGVVIRDPEESATPSTIIHIEAKFKDKGKWIMLEEPKPLKKQAQIEQDEAYARELEAELNKNIDWDELIDHVQRKQKDDNAVKRYQALKRKPQTKAQARKNMMIYLRNVAGFKMDYFKGITYDDIRPIFEKKFNSNVAFLQKIKEQMKEEDNRALKRLSETQEEKAAKKQKLDEEVAELKRYLQIVPNDDDDDVYTEATPLARKVPVVDYEIYTENNKPYYKIIRADRSP